uniref:Uncharacterized protein n=1 Tax=Anguilla anguilla TaxID=7936 RepID=A0A0E9X9P8_ANGAN
MTVKSCTHRNAHTATAQ